MSIRVLQVVTTMGAGGIESFLMNIYRNIDRGKVQFDFLVHRNCKGHFDDEIRRLGGNIYYVPPINPLHHRKYISELNNFLATHNYYHVVHSHNNAYSMFFLRSAKKMGIKTRIAHSHISKIPLLYYRTPFILYTKSKIKKYTTHNFACSEMAGKWLYGKKATKDVDFKIVNNAIKTSDFAFNDTNRITTRKSLGIEGNFVIGHIGRFADQKNHEFLIDVFFEIYQRNHDARLLLVGDGELRNKIESKAKQLGIFDKIIFTGIRSDIPALLHAMDVFVLPSLYEGLGIVVVEAQAAGLKCVVSDQVPSEAFVTNLVITESLKSNIAVWAEKILSCNSSYERKNTVDEVVSSGYDILRVAKWLEDFYVKQHRVGTL